MDDYPAADPIPDIGIQHDELIDYLTNSRDMRKTAKSSMKQAMYAGGAALAGGFLLGPIGQSLAFSSRTITMALSCA
jgi:hypothetical protein